MKKAGLISQVLAFILIISILITTGCKDKNNATSENGTTNNTTGSTSNPPAARRPLDDLLKLPDPNELAATVNGVEIKESQIQEIIRPQMDSIKESLKSAPDTLQVESIVTQNVKMLRESALQQLIIEQLLDEQVKDLDINITDEEADALFQKRLEKDSVNIDQFKQVLKDNNITYEEVLQEVKKEQIYTKFVESQMGDSVNATEDDAKKYYEEKESSFVRPEDEVRVSHILAEFKPDETEAVKAKAKEKIDDLLRQVKEGADFAELAKANSDDDTSAVDGGDLGYFGLHIMDPNFEKASFETPVGEVSDIIETDYGYHILKATDHKDAGQIPFDEIKEQLIDALTKRNKSEFTAKFVDSLLKEADIKFPEGKEISFELTEE